MRRLPLLLLLLSTLLLAACPANRPGESEHALAAPGKPTPNQETRMLTVRPDALRIDGDHVVFAPDSRVQRASYDVYRFAKDDFQAKVGTLTPAAPIRLMIEVLATREARRTPSDPSMPAPEGGFVTRTHECRITRVER